MTQAEIKAWLKASGNNRAWLASALCVSVSTVNQLLYSKRAIPARMEKLLARLMREQAASPAASAPAPAPAPEVPENVLVLTASPSEFEAWNSAALAAGQLVTVWAAGVLNAAAGVSE